MPEREVYDYETGKWVTIDDSQDDQRDYGDAGGSPAPTPAAGAPHWRRNRDVTPGMQYTDDDGTVRNVDPNSEWVWDDEWGQWQIRPKSMSAPQQTAPPTAPYTGGGGGGGWGYLTEPFMGKPPSWISGPSFQAPSFVTPPPFAFREFAAPTSDSIYADPSFQFRTSQGKQALEQSAAGRGVLRTGGTLKDLVDYGQQAASQEYANIFDRAVQSHNMGLEQALGTYATNYGVTRDAYDRMFEASKASFEGMQRENELMNQREFDRFLADYDIFERNRRRVGDYLFQGAGLG